MKTNQIRQTNYRFVDRGISDSPNATAFKNLNAVPFIVTDETFNISYPTKYAPLFEDAIREVCKQTMLTNSTIEKDVLGSDDEMTTYFINPTNPDFLLHVGMIYGLKVDAMNVLLSLNNNL